MDLTWEDWSAYIDPMDFTPDSSFRDILVPRLGIEYVLEKTLALRGGYAYIPSPVPDQLQGQNYLDCNKHVFSIGAGYTWEQIPWLKIWPNPFTLNGYFQYSWLVNRTYNKDPGFGPDVDLGGYMLNGGLSIKLHF